MVSAGWHPTASYARACAADTDHKRLVASFEATVTEGPGDVELLAAIAIARVELLERDGLHLQPVSRLARTVSDLSASNVVPLRRHQTRAPAPGTGRPGA